VGFLDGLLGEPPKPEGLLNREQGTRFMLSTVVVPPLVVYAKSQGLSVQDGVTLAIKEGVTFARVQADPTFNALMSSMGGALQSLSKQYGDAAKLRPGETVEGSADWILKQVAGMTFQTSFGPVKGTEVYAAVVNAPNGPDWFRALIRDIYHTVGVR